MSSKNSNSGGIGFLSLLAIVFITLKLTSVIDWSWWYVTMPLWGGIALFACFGVLCLLFVAAVNVYKYCTRS